MTFDNGLTVLTDYGQSRAWGLDSPIHGFGTLVPDVATRSHDHLDHAGGVLPEGIGLLLKEGAAGEVRGVSIAGLLLTASTAWPASVRVVGLTPAPE